jgi:hypothetical protein
MIKDATTIDKLSLLEEIVGLGCDTPEKKSGCLVLLELLRLAKSRKDTEVFFYDCGFVLGVKSNVREFNTALAAKLSGVTRNMFSTTSPVQGQNITTEHLYVYVNYNNETAAQKTAFLQQTA